MPTVISHPVERLRRVVDTRLRAGELSAPLAVVDVDAFDYNAAQMTSRAKGLPIRVASKSLRSVAALKRALSHDGYSGILAYTLPEAINLVGQGFDDIVVAYPSVDKIALNQLSREPRLAAAITIMVDCVEHLELIPVGGQRIRVAIDIDCTLHLPGGVIGPRRSPLREPGDVQEFARQILSRDHLHLVGMMAYEGQVASVPDGQKGPVGSIKRWLRNRSMTDLAPRRAECIAAVRELTDLEFVNGGGTGSLELSAAEGTLTELAAGSGFYTPAIFDQFTDINHKAAAFFVCQVSRIPANGWATVNSGGWIASGPPADDRVPVPVWPKGLTYSGTEGAGEVQTPLKGDVKLRVGQPVWFRHAKAGEMTEHVGSILALGAGVEEYWDTYRGQGWTLR